MDIYQIHGESGSREGRIALDAEGKISGAYFPPTGPARVTPRRSPKDY
jgi:hypothetical protein